MIKEYPVKGEKVFILPDVELTYNMKMFGWGIRSYFIGGYVWVREKKIFIKESRKDDIKLLNHERGHLRGYGHTWKPTLMFPSWIGRIFNRY